MLHAHSSTLGDASAFKRFLLGRNKLWVVAKNMPTPDLLRMWPIVAGYDGLAVGYGVATRGDFASARPYRWIGWAQTNLAQTAHRPTDHNGYEELAHVYVSACAALGRAQPLCPSFPTTMTSLLTGLALGLSAGISPGPLLTLVITRTLAHGFWAGLRICIAPLLSDLPIILITLLLFNALPPMLETVLTIGGGLFVIYLGVETMRSARRTVLGSSDAAAQDGGLKGSTDLMQGAMVNAFSPHPWLFWIGIGSPTLTRAYAISWWNAVAFLLGFYTLLVGGKIGVALAVAGSRRFLTECMVQTAANI